MARQAAVAQRIKVFSAHANELVHLILDPDGTVRWERLEQIRGTTAGYTVTDTILPQVPDV